MTKAKHRIRIPWRQLRREYGKLMTEHDRLQRQHRELARRWSKDHKELIRLQETYETPPGTSWARYVTDVDAMISKGIIHQPPELEEITDEVSRWNPPDSEAETKEYPLYGIAVDPAVGTDPAGVVQYVVHPDRTVEVVEEESP